VTPYDWQSSLAQRAQYIQERLSLGLPAAAVSVPEGIVIVSVARSSQKIFEIHDRLSMVGLGQQADIEALRVGAIDFCHKEGFERSEDDVTLGRLTMSMSQGLKRAFADFRGAPIAVRTLISEIGDKPEGDSFLVMDFDGEYQAHSRVACIAGREADSEKMQLALMELSPAEPAALAESICSILEEALPPQLKRDLPNGDSKPAVREKLKREAILVRRGEGLERRFAAIPFG
jgi:proteasome alpha subunit